MPALNELTPQLAVRILMDLKRGLLKKDILVCRITDILFGSEISKFVFYRNKDFSNIHYTSSKISTTMDFYIFTSSSCKYL